MTFKQLKLYIANALERDESAFVEGTFNSLAQAVTNAMRSLQRQHDFEYLRTFGYVTFPENNVWRLSPIIDENTGDAAEIKKIERAYFVEDGGKECPIRVVGRESEFDKELERAEVRGPMFQHPLKLERHGAVFRVLNAPTDTRPLTFRFDIVRWLPPFVGDAESNFLSENGSDVLLYHALAELNLFMKESEQVELSSAFYNARWRSLLKWDADQFDNVAQDIFE